MVADLDAFDGPDVVVIPVSLGQARIARDAYRSFGRGNHPAGLNFGDCFAYALAKERDLPLLFKGDDFASPLGAVTAWRRARRRTACRAALLQLGVALDLGLGARVGDRAKVGRADGLGVLP